ncbi:MULTISPECIES: sulfatase [unclassified Haladaptatus]|uniref:sulfatase n=1 Tax=unclassified Haladaptatus TaxID=2622732 RepID=UPI0023E83DC8|nr:MULTISPECIES: sulfatase [unclassified Haladaptatus]
MTATKHKNIVIVVMDTVRKDALSVYNANRSTSPNLEQFAANAVVFDQAVSPAPWTLPVHASLFTGEYPSQHGASQETPYLADSITLADTLSNEGYSTACFTSNAWITPYTGLTSGFAVQDNFFEVLPGDFISGPLAKCWQVFNDNSTLRSVTNRLVELGNDIHEHLAQGDGADSKTPAVVDKAIDFIDRTEGPSFTFVNLMDAHLPYYPPEEYRELYAPDVDPTEVCQNSKEYNSGARDIDDDEWEAIRGLYAAEIRHLDAELGRLLDWLRENDEEDTLVAVCADHGELHGEHGLYGHEFGIYDPLVNVPLMVSHPDLEAGERDDQVELLDLYHTVLDHAGVSPREPAVPLDRRRSLLSADYRDFAGGEYAFIEYDQPVIELSQLETKASNVGITLDENSRYYSRMRGVRRADAKFIQNEGLPDELYFIDDDPEELHDRAGRDRTAERELESALSDFEATTGSNWTAQTDSDGSIDEMSVEAKSRLRELGYLE